MNSYFSHDSNARNDDKVLKVRMTYGMEGYGIYFAIIERLREEQDYIGKRDYNVLGFDFHVDAAKVKDIVENFGLFSFTDNGECFYSESLNDRMAHMDNSKAMRSQAGRKGAAKRWGNQAIAEPSETDSNAMAMPSVLDGNKTKLNKTKLNNTKESTTSPKRGKRVYADDSPELLAANHLFEKIRDNNPEHKKPDLQGWANDMRLMHEQDKRSWDKINNMIDACQADEFWQGNILSAAKLRKQYDSMKSQFNARAKQQLSNPKQRVKGIVPSWMNQDSDSKGQSAQPTVTRDEIQAKLARVAKTRAELNKNEKEVKS